MADHADVAAHDLGVALLEIARHEAVPSTALRERGIVERVPELAVLAETPQDARWHPEGDVLVHSLWAADLAAEYADEHEVDGDRRELLVIGALLHDVGKPDTTQRTRDRITSHGHAERGAEIIRSLGERLGLPDALVDAVAAIAANHMVHYGVQGEPSPKAVRGLRHRLERAGATLEDWAVVLRCDSAARGPAAAKPDPSVPWLRVDRRSTE